MTTFQQPPAPWWKFGHVWMVIAGPALVVVASFATYYIAVSGMDKVIDEPVTVSAPTRFQVQTAELCASRSGAQPCGNGNRH